MAVAAAAEGFDRMDIMEIDDSLFINKKLMREGLVTKVEFPREKLPSRRFSVCLWLMCALLLAGNIGQFVYYNVFHPLTSPELSNSTQLQNYNISKEKVARLFQQDLKELQIKFSQLKTENDRSERDFKQLQHNLSSLKTEGDKSKQDFQQLQGDFSTLKTEKEQLQRSYSALDISKKQLQSNYNSLRQAKQQLQTIYDDLSVQKEQLQSNYQNLETENVKSKVVFRQLQSNFSTVKAEKEQLQRSYGTLSNSKDQLQSNYDAINKEKESLKTNLDALKKEKEQLQSTYHNLEMENDKSKVAYQQLQGDLSTLKSEKEQLQRSYDTLSTSKDQLQSNYVALNQEKDSLTTLYNNMKQTYSSVLEVRDQLQKKFDRARKNVLCENDWKKFDLGCYFFSKTTKNWNQSREFCISKGGDLVVLNSKEEQAFVNGWLKTSQNAWIGLFDIETEGTWKWVDGTVVTTTYWQPGQPNSYGGNQDCGEILQDSGGVGQWNDDACTGDQTWVCEK